MIIRDPHNPRWRRRSAGRVLQNGRAQPIGRRTARIRQNFSRKSQYTLVRLSNQWRGLSEAQRGLWETFGASYPQTDKYGFTVYWNGWLWFQRLNFLREMWRQPINATPPTDPNNNYNPQVIDVQFDVNGNLQVWLNDDPAGFQFVAFSYLDRLQDPFNTSPSRVSPSITYMGPSSSPFVILPATMIPRGNGWLQLFTTGYDTAGRKSIRVRTSVLLVDA